MGTSSQVELLGVSPAIHEEDKKTQLQNIHGKYGISFSNSKMTVVNNKQQFSPHIFLGHQA
jgi:hypothetical protein